MTFSLILQCFVLNLALMILTLIGSQLISALCASFDSMSASPCVCGVLASSFPECNTISPDESFVCPDCPYGLTQPNKDKFITSPAINVAFLASYIVLTFQVPILIVLMSVGSTARHPCSFHYAASSSSFEMKVLLLPSVVGLSLLLILT